MSQFIPNCDLLDEEFLRRPFIQDLDRHNSTFVGSAPHFAESALPYLLISQDLEFSVDKLTHSIHAIDTSADVAGRAADLTLSEAAASLQRRHEQIAERTGGRQVDTLDALR